MNFHLNLRTVWVEFDQILDHALGQVERFTNFTHGSVEMVHQLYPLFFPFLFLLDRNINTTFDESLIHEIHADRPLHINRACKQGNKTPSLLIHIKIIMSLS